jgi:hypothetical protein
MSARYSVIEEILDWRPYDYVTDRTILDPVRGAEGEAGPRARRAGPRSVRGSAPLEPPEAGRAA